MKRRWFPIPLLTAVVATSISTGVMSADGHDPISDTPHQTLASRVADNLGLDEALVRDAVQQARRDMGDEAADRRLARLVEHERISQDVADEYWAWFRSRPQGFQVGAKALVIPERILRHKLARMARHGRITEKQVAQYLDWFQQRPEGILPKWHALKNHMQRSFDGGSERDHGRRGEQGWAVAPVQPTRQSCAQPNFELIGWTLERNRRYCPTKGGAISAVLLFSAGEYAISGQLEIEKLRAKSAPGFLAAGHRPLEEFKIGVIAGTMLSRMLRIFSASGLTL